MMKVRCIDFQEKRVQLLFSFLFFGNIKDCNFSVRSQEMKNPKKSRNSVGTNRPGSVS